MEGREIQPTGDAVIGREGVDIVLADPEVSRRHAAIRRSGDGVAIEDLGSTNGTFVNDRRITGVVVLSDGDTVRFGNTVWRLRAPAPEPAGATRLGQVHAAPPEVTTARPMPTEVQPPAAPAQPAPAAAAAPQAPAAPAAPSPAVIGPRGDVPPPPDVAPSAIRRVLPQPAPGHAPAFAPPGARNITTKRGSQATRVEATIVCLAIVVLVAIALVVYFGAQ